MKTIAHSLDLRIFNRLIAVALFTLGVSAAGPLSAQVPEGYREVQVNGVTHFGLDPAWKTGREFEKALDGDAASFYDFAYRDRESFVGFDGGEAVIPEAIHFQPRPKWAKRMVGGKFQGSNESSVSGYETIYAVTATPVYGANIVPVSTSKSYRYFRYLAPAGSYGNIAEFSVSGRTVEATVDTGSGTEIPDAVTAAPEGFRTSELYGITVFGLDPAWASGREFEKALDGDPNTFYDFADGSRETFVGADAGREVIPATLYFTPRKGKEERMVGGLFQGSNEGPHSGYETFYEVTGIPADSGVQVPLVDVPAYRYFRYLAPAGSFGNIAEFGIYVASDSSTDGGTDTGTADGGTGDTGTTYGDPVDSGTGDSGTITGDPVGDGTDTSDGVTAEPEGFRTSELYGITVFGLDPAWASGREFEKALDGDPNTFYDFADGSRETFVGADAGREVIPATLYFTPRKGKEERMVGGLFQGSNEGPYSGYETFYEVTGIPAESGVQIPLEDVPTYRYFRYLAPAGSYGNIAEFGIYIAPEAETTDGSSIPETGTSGSETTDTPSPSETDSTTETGTYREAVVDGLTVFGLDPAWASGREFEKALDGDPATFYDYASGDSTFVGFDAGEAGVPRTIRYTPRAGHPERMLFGRFEGSNESPLNGFTTIHLITSTPSDSEQVAQLPGDAAYRYYRYVAPSGGYGNIAEFSVEMEVAGDSGSTSDPAPVEDPAPSEDPASTPDSTGEVISGEGVTAQVLPNGAGVQLSFELQDAGRVSAGIYDSAGHMVRTLLYGENLSSGSHYLVWDGLDRDGSRVGTGNFTFKVLRTDGLVTEYITSLGINPGTVPYDSWVGDHHGVASVAIDASGVYFTASASETSPMMLKQSVDGTERMWIRGDVTSAGHQGGISVASDNNGRVYMLEPKGMLQAINGATGKVEGSWNVLPSDVNLSDYGKWGRAFDHSSNSIAGADLAANGSTVVVSFKDQNKIVWIDPSNGSVLSQVSIAQPLGVAVDRNGGVYAISGRAIYRVSRSGATDAVVTSSLTAPKRICVDPTDNTILVSDGFKNAQVKRFSQAGNLLSTYGREGGRRFGTYVASDFFGITDIVADGTGGFFVAEAIAPPRRVVQISRSGAVVEQYFGGQPFFTYAEPDPIDPTESWVYTGDGMIRVKIDLSTKTWKVLESWWIKNLAQGLIEQSAGYDGRWRVLYASGKRYLVSEKFPQVLAHSENDLRAVSVTSREPGQIDRAIELAGFGSGARTFRWVDQNGDGEPQSSEFEFSQSILATVATVKDDFSLISRDRDTFGTLKVVETRAKWSTYGPYYPFANESGYNLTVASTPTRNERVAVWGTGAYGSSDGSYYAHYNLESEVHGITWPTDLGGVSRFVKWDSNGNELWSVGRHAYNGGFVGLNSKYYLPRSPGGQMHVPVKVIGEVSGSVILADRVETPGMVWTKDGLYVGSLFDKRVNDGLPETVYNWWVTDTTVTGLAAITTSDNACGGSIVGLGDGTALWFTGGRNSVPVYRVYGWDQWDRLEASFALTSEAATAEASGTGLQVAYYEYGMSGLPLLSRIESQIWNGLPDGASGQDRTIDGRSGAANDWSSGPAGLGRATGFAARWTGEIEAPLSEEFIFSAYMRGGVRVWVDGQQIISSWNEETDRVQSAPVWLEAGKRYRVQVDYRTRRANPAISLNWESTNLDRQRVPADYLYPTTSATVMQHSHDAKALNSARSFDLDSGTVLHSEVDTNRVSGQNKWGFGALGSYVGYETVEFGTSVSRLIVHAGGRPAGRDQFPITLAFRLGSPNGTTIAEVALNPEVERIEMPVSGVSGTQDLYVVNTTGDTHYIDFQFYRFE